MTEEDSIFIYKQARKEIQKLLYLMAEACGEESLTGRAFLQVANMYLNSGHSAECGIRSFSPDPCDIEWKCKSECSVMAPPTNTLRLKQDQICECDDDHYGDIVYDEALGQRTYYYRCNKCYLEQNFDGTERN